MLSRRKDKREMFENLTSASSIYDFTVKDLHNDCVKLSKYDNGKVLLIVNFATNDELADRNFLELKDLKLKFCDGDKNWRWKHFIEINASFLDISILMFPCCQFGDMMPERENSEIYCWCKFEGIEFADVFSMVRFHATNLQCFFISSSSSGWCQWT